MLVNDIIKKMAASGLFPQITGTAAGVPSLGSSGVLGATSAPSAQSAPLTESAGVFADYMRQNMVKKTPNFMPPTMKPVGMPATPTTPTGPVMGGGVDIGSGGGGDTSTAGTGSVGGSLFGGVPGANAGISTTLAGVLGSLFGGTPGALAARGLVGGYNSMNDKANAIAQAEARMAELMHDAEVDASYGSSTGLLGMDAAAPGDYGGFGSGMTDSGDGGYGGDGGLGDAGDAGVGGGGFAFGGKVTKKRLAGPNPKGPDDGFGALDIGELVVPAKVAKKLSKRQVAGLLGR